MNELNEELKEAVLHLRIVIGISVILFIAAAFYHIYYALGIASSILILGLVMYIGKLESTIKRYENIIQDREVIKGG